jgi:hypothetical protein
MSGASPVALAPERSRTLHAVVQRFLPGTNGPGAADTGVAAALETALQHRSWRAMRPWLEHTLDQLQSQAGALHGREFCACSSAAQDELLQALERDPHPARRLVFRSLIVLSLEGLLGDPVHGGNRGFRAWEAMGLQPRDVRSGMCRGARET